MADDPQGDENQAYTWRTVCRIGELADGEGKTVTVGGRLIAVFHVQGQYHAIDDTCPHMGASLSGGYVEEGVVTCPWHAWRFRLCDGVWADNPRIKIGSYVVRIEGEAVQVRVDGPAGDKK
ncbi:MAG TPA: nitrite reductase small subunit NirD [Gemmataceae bacterium]|nr:nitrite reductase small subunit NirD [Gemmataceae bacterium]